MATTVTIKLNKAAHEFQAGDSTGFGIRGGVQYYDRETKSKQWTNYEAAVFSKSQQMTDFYRSVLVEGAIVEVTCLTEKIKQFNGQNGLSLSIEMIDAKLGAIFQSAPSNAQQGYQQPQQNYQQPQYQQPQQNYQQPQYQPQPPKGSNQPPKYQGR